jgi:hypothetical protein
MKEVPMSISKLENARPTEVTDKINEIIKKLDDDSQWKVFTPTTGTIDTGTWAQNSIVQMQAWADIITNAGSTIKNAAMLLIPKWGSVGTPATATSCKFSHSFPGAPDITITIPAGNILIVSFGSSGGVQEYSCIAVSSSESIAQFKALDITDKVTSANGVSGGDYEAGNGYKVSPLGFVFSGLYNGFRKFCSLSFLSGGVWHWIIESIKAATIQTTSLTVDLALTLPDKSIKAAMLDDLAVGTGKLANGAVETSKLDDEAVTLAKLDADVKRDLFTVNSQRFSPDGETSGIMILPRVLTLNRMLHIAINTNLWVWSSSAVQFSIIVGTETYTNLSNWTIYNGSSIRYMDVAVTADMVDMAVSIVLNTANVTAGSLWVTVQQHG